ncbi:MAG: rhomboid family intramembrane serine protease [Acidimicrobiales bacterium]
MTQAPIGHQCPECVAAASPTGNPLQTRPAAQTPVTVALIAVNLAMYAGQVLSRQALTEWGILFGPAVAVGEWWRVITGGFLHADLLHIGFNMYALWIFGPSLERGLGPVRYALIYLAGLLGGSFAVLAFAFIQPTLGASGAVLGLGGCLAAVYWARGINIFRTSLAPVLLINLALPLISNISFWGHLGGTVAGFLAGLVVAWLPTKIRMTATQATAAVGGLCVILLIAAAAVADRGGLIG